VKTLLLIPVYNCGKILPIFFGHLKRLDPQPDLYVFAENNSSDSTLDQVWKFDLPHKVIRVWFRKDAAILNENRYVAIAHIRQLLLTFARHYDPDYAIFLDSDILPQTRELIDNLTSWRKDVVGGPYLRLFPEGLWIATRWQASDNPNRCMFLRSPRTALDEPLMTSGGCLCLSHRIIQDKRMNFYPLYGMDASEDFGYCIRARDLGYGVYLDSTVSLLHYFPNEMPIKPWSRSTSTGKYMTFSYGE
jgi:GT2 family glycosyltransferase